MITRRQFLKAGAYAGGSLMLLRTGALRRAWAALPGGTLDPTSVPKFVTPLVIPPVMPMTTTLQNGAIDYYQIAVRQFSQRILPAGFPATTVWGYGRVGRTETFNYPAFTIEARVDRPVRVNWMNQLMDGSGDYLPHLLPVDPTLHWANPPGGVSGRDMRPEFDTTPGPYTGPVPIAVHLHGGHTVEESDGHPESWWLPPASNIPSGYAKVGSLYEEFAKEFASKWGASWKPGTALFQYQNDQRASSLWFHDHTLGMTRLNVYAGPAGFYLLRGGSADLAPGILPGPAPRPGDAPGTQYYEIPLAIQDRSFNADGSLFYPSSRAFFDGFEGPYIGEDGSDISPIFNPEVFANTMVVNGRTWPVLNVEPRRYRFRVLNGCNSRFLILKISADAQRRPARTALPIWAIGTEGGFLPAPLKVESLLMGLAERFDVIVDFTGLRPGTELYLINEAPDEPFGGGVPGRDFEPADPATTGQVLKFRVVKLASRDTSVPPSQLSLPTFTPLGEATKTRHVSLNEADSAVLEGVGPRAAFLGTADAEGNSTPLGWDDPVTENPALGAIENWVIHNNTVDAHPIHIHEVMFEVTDREGAEDKSEPTGPEVWEAGFKDTVIAYPGEATTVKAQFDQAGRFVWHCHIVEHEDNEMMRPYRIG